MKKLLLTAVATLVCFGVFAQGKLSFINNANQLIYFTTSQAGLASGDAGKTVNGATLAGQTLYSGAGSTLSSLAGAPTLIAGLFGGVTADALTLQSTTSFQTAIGGGFLNGVSMTFPSIPASVPAFFRIDIYDARATDAATAWAAGLYGGSSGVFTAVPSVGAYSPIYQTTAPVNSTMPIGTFVPVDYTGFPGYFGSMAVYVVPEPGMFALAGLGAAALMIFRRRK